MKKNTYWDLPPGYSLEREVKLPEDRGALKIMAVLQLVLAAALIVFGLWHHPIREAFYMGAARTAAAFCCGGRSLRGKCVPCPHGPQGCRILFFQHSSRIFGKSPAACSKELTLCSRSKLLLRKREERLRLHPYRERNRRQGSRNFPQNRR